MNDETKAAVEWLRGWYCTAPTDAQPGTIAYRVRLLLAHLDSEPARLAAAREEQREADVRSCSACKGEGFTMQVRECPFCADSTHDHECPTDKVRVNCACGAARIRTTPLDARPLADRIAELERELSKAEWRVAELEDDVADTRILLEPHFGQETLAKMTADLIAEWQRREAAEEKAEEGVRYWTDLAQAEARDAAALRTRVAELEAQISKAEARVAELEREARELTQENVRLDDLARNWREGAKRVEKELAHWRSRAIDADARLREVQDELAHEKGGRLDEAAIRAACERETGVWPYGRIADAIVETLRTQQVHWEAFVTAESERAEKAEARVEELEQHKDDLKTMIQDLRGRAEKAEARVAELEAQDDLNAARAVLAKYPEEE